MLCLRIHLNTGFMAQFILRESADQGKPRKKNLPEVKLTINMIEKAGNSIGGKID